MRNVFLLAAVAAVTIATPALANEARVEARGGIYWVNGDSNATAGVAAGYDFDLGDMGFAGLEVGADKVLESDTKISFNGTARIGLKTNETGKFYIAGGYTTEPCDLCVGAWHAGVGLEQGLAGKIYAKGEYRHFFSDLGAPEADAFVIGLGVKY